MSSSGSGNQPPLTKSGQVDKRYNKDSSTGQSVQSNVAPSNDTETEGVYKPSEHSGLTKSGQPDKRMASGHGFGSNKEFASEAGRKGGEAERSADK